MEVNKKRIISRVVIALLLILFVINIINVIRYDQTPKLTVTLKEAVEEESGYTAIFKYSTYHVKHIYPEYYENVDGTPKEYYEPIGLAPYTLNNHFNVHNLDIFNILNFIIGNPSKDEGEIYVSFYENAYTVYFSSSKDASKRHECGVGSNSDLQNAVYTAKVEKDKNKNAYKLITAKSKKKGSDVWIKVSFD